MSDQKNLKIAIGYDPFYELGKQAATNHHWQNAITLFEESLNHYGINVSTLYNCALAHSQLGQYEKTLEYLKKIDLENNNLNKYKALYNSINCMLTREKKFGIEDCNTKLAYSSEIRLSLLGVHFSKRLYNMQQDSEIRSLTRLKRLLSVEQTRNWINEECSRENKITFAVIHEKFGMIGLTALEMYGKGALFHYWIGKEYQNKGYGTIALNLLTQCAKQLSIEYCFSSVFPNNIQSINAMKKVGFEEIPNVREIDSVPLPFYYKKTSCDILDDKNAYQKVFNEIIKQTAIPIKEFTDI
jgi:RimJ/RimL family protein N-acetyltransferase